MYVEDICLLLVLSRRMLRLLSLLSRVEGVPYCFSAFCLLPLLLLVWVCLISIE
jgi:hypothetical protein